MSIYQNASDDLLIFFDMVECVDSQATKRAKLTLRLLERALLCQKRWKRVVGKYSRADCLMSLRVNRNHRGIFVFISCYLEHCPCWKNSKNRNIVVVPNALRDP